MESPRGGEEKHDPERPDIDSIKRMLQELKDLHKSHTTMSFEEFKEAIAVVARLNAPVFEECKRIPYRDLISKGESMELQNALNRLVRKNLKPNGISIVNYKGLARLVRNLARKESDK